MSDSESRMSESLGETNDSESDPDMYGGNEHAYGKKRRRYTEDEDSNIVNFLKENAGKMTTKNMFRAMVEKKVVERPAASVFEHFREVINPRIQNGKIPVSETTKEALASSYCPKTARKTAKGTRSIVHPSDVVKVCEYLAEVSEKICPTSEAWWKNQLSKKSVEIEDAHPARCVSIYRLHIKDKFEKVDVPKETREALMHKLGRLPNNGATNAVPTPVLAKTISPPTSSASLDPSTREVGDLQETMDDGVINEALHIAGEVYVAATEGNKVQKSCAGLVIRTMMDLELLAKVLSKS